MFTIQKTTICKEDIATLLLEINGIIAYEEVPQEEIHNILCAVSEKADWSIDSILSNTIQEIENGQIRNWFRRFLISEKYAILIDYPRRIKYLNTGNSNYYIVYAWDDCVLVHSDHIVIGNELVKPHSTIVLSPESELKVPENEVYLYENSITRHGFTSRWNNLYGLFTSKGDMFLPCVFESIEQKEYDGWVTLCYQGIYYWMQYGVHGPGSPVRAVYKYNELILSIYALGGNSSFIKKRDKYLTANSQGELDVMIAENSKELFGVLDTYLHRLSNEEILEVEKRG